MADALIALGANLGGAGRDLAATLTAALDRLAGPDIVLRARSRWYRSPAWPPGSGPDFINGAARLTTTLDPAALLARLHAVEADLGRTRPGRWVPRTCDLDLIAWDDAVLPDAATVRAWMALDQGQAQTVTPPHLILPHPRLTERAFVLVPLAEVAPDWRHPLTGQDMAAMLVAIDTAGLVALD